MTRPDFDPYSGFSPDTDLNEIVYGKSDEVEQKTQGLLAHMASTLAVTKWGIRLYEGNQEEDRPEKPPRPEPAKPRVTVEVAGRWRYMITLHYGWFYEAHWYRYGLERAKHKASYELYKYCKQQDMLDLPPVVTYSTE